MTNATYYRKLKAKKFEVDELEKIFTILYPEEAEKYKVNELIETSIKEAKSDGYKTQEQIMDDYDKLFLGK